MSGEGAAIRVRVEGGSVVVVECVDVELCSILERRGYLSDGRLDALEAVFQAQRGKLELGGLTGWRAALELVERLGVPLKVAIVYVDLRRRGRLPRRGVRRGTLIYPSGSRSVEVMVLEEGETVTYGWVADWSRLAVADGREPVIAIVDRNGDVTYYEARVSTSIS